MLIPKNVDYSAPASLAHIVMTYAHFAKSSVVGQFEHWDFYAHHRR